MPRYAVFTVSLSKVSEEVVTVDYSTVDGTATAAADDYVPASGTLTFEPNELSKEVLVLVRQDDAEKPAGVFSLIISTPSNGTLGVKRTGTVSLPGIAPAVPDYLTRFNLVYDATHADENEYFGPTTGPIARQRVVPKHIAGIDSKIINEAPDCGGETVSETASFWVGLEAWKGWVSGHQGTPDWSGYKNCWDKIDKYYVPSMTNAPFSEYNPESPADYTPEGELPSMYPRLSQPNAQKGVDPLWDDLKATYNSDRMHLMHWIIDVEGDYGFKNGDGQTTCVFINTYERGLQESSFETITHPAWNDWNNGGGEYGFEPLYTQGAQDYPAAMFDWGKKWSYTCAPDSEIRAVQWAFWAGKFAAEQSQTTAIAPEQSQARKMGDYARYVLFDKYFRKIGDNQVGSDWDEPYAACHYLVNWYVAWGGEIPATPGDDPTWGYAVGCSECHQGYQGIITAYALATGGGGMAPASPGAGDIWLGSLYRQIEMVRWLQSPEGPIAGGVTNSWKAQYASVSDGRERATFYGMHYTYSPVWHDPPSNNWVGFQAWGQGRTADLFLEVSDKTTPLAVAVRPNLEIILDRLVAWFMPLVEFTEDGSYILPSTLSWVTDERVVGETTNVPNLEGVYEFIPSTSWDGTGSYADFWRANTVPNPTLHCTVQDSGTDLGVAASMSYLLLTYAEAKRRMNKFDTNIPNSGGLKPRDVYILARRLIDRSWKYWDGVGICIDEPRVDYDRMADEIYIPTSPRFEGQMPNGDIVEPGVTFIDTRTFLKDDPMWPACEAYINGTGDAPVFRYHRFWAQAEYAICCAAMERYFADINDTVEYTI